MARWWQSRADKQTTRRYIYDHSFEWLLGILSCVASLGFFASPDALDHAPVGQALHPYDYLWNIGYFLGGAFLVWGVWRVRPRYEASGLVFLMTALLIQTIAVITERGVSGMVSIVTFTAVVVASVFRLSVLFRGEPVDAGLAVKDKT